MKSIEFRGRWEYMWRHYLRFNCFPMPEYVSVCGFVCLVHVCYHLKQVQKLPALITPYQSHQHSLQTSPYTHHPPLHPHHRYGNHICRKRNHLKKKKKTWGNEISEMLELVVLRDKQTISHPYPLCLKEIQQPSLSDLLSLSLSLSWQSCSFGCGVCDKREWLFLSLC